jgi:hypothetical protein
MRGAEREEARLERGWGKKGRKMLCKEKKEEIEERKVKKKRKIEGKSKQGRGLRKKKCAKWRV